MSEVKVNKISPRTNCGTVQLGDSGDTITIPAGATITNNGTQTGFGRTGTVDWDTTAKTASFTAVSGNGYFVNTTSGAITVTLPAGSAGDIISLADYAATWQTNAVTITPNGTDKIGGANANAILATVGQSVTFVYTDSTQGWLNTMDSTSNVRGTAFITATGGTITCCGDYKIHTFTGPGTFCVSCAGNPAGSDTIEYIVVAGGGSGGGGYYGGGGGAGGFRFASPSLAPLCYPAKPLAGSTLTVTATGYPITVGGGGSAPTVSCVQGNNGSNSIFSTITSAGGGGGGSWGNSVADVRCGVPGGSGGGSSSVNSSGASPSNAIGGTGNTPPVSPSQGNDGGDGGINVSTGPDNTAPAAGGGGALAVGQDLQPGPGAGGYGGVGGGLPAAFGANGQPCGSFRYYAGGGGGGGDNGTCNVGGLGGGGAGGRYPVGGPANPVMSGTPGTVNTGGGGGGKSGDAPFFSGNGGSGIVIIRYKYQ
jgi:hypothetical protein